MISLRHYLNIDTLFTRLRYPYSMPAEIGEDLGLELDNRHPFHKFLQVLASPANLPRKLYKFMPRDEVCSLFRHARRMDDFQSKIFFCYYFRQGWIEFEAHFDNNRRLCRLRLMGAAPDLKEREIPLRSTII